MNNFWTAAAPCRFHIVIHRLGFSGDMATSEWLGSEWESGRGLPQSKGSDV